MIYSLSNLILTNKRIIKIEEKGLFNYYRLELDLDKIEDIQVEIHGFFGNLLNYGKIVIQTCRPEIKFTVSFLA